jgi:hypothetical protein
MNIFEKIVKKHWFKQVGVTPISVVGCYGHGHSWKIEVCMVEIQ